jgi:serine/threonine protein kinase
MAGDSSKVGRFHERVGRVIADRWRVDALLHAGPTSAVYAATDTRRDTRAALKILHPELAADEQMRKRFQREGYAANAVGHPGVVGVHAEATTEEGAPVLVMELLDGEPLDAIWTDAGGKLPLADVVKYGVALLEILAAAHARGIIHRDLKPANVFVTRRGEVKILDFGLACEKGRTESISGLGVVMGTPAFMAPEQALGLRERIDPRTDLWALGATLFTLLSGRAVHEVDSPQAQFYLAATAQAPGIREVAPEVPPAIAAVIDRALAFEGNERWEDADAMRYALRRASSTKTTTPALPIARVQLVQDAAPTQIVKPPDENAPTIAALDVTNELARSIAPIDSLTPSQRSLSPRAPPPPTASPLALGAFAALTACVVTILALTVVGRITRSPRSVAITPPPSAPAELIVPAVDASAD